MFKYIVDYKNFLHIKKNKNLEIKLLKKLNSYFQKKIIQSFSEKYNYAFDNIDLRKYKNFKNINIIGIGGSSLGIKAIYNFFSPKINRGFAADFDHHIYFGICAKLLHSN